MEHITEIIFSETLKIWKTNFDISQQKEMVKICKNIIKENPNVNNDGYPFYIETIKTTDHVDIKTKTILDAARNHGINSCIDLNKSLGKQHNLVNIDCWINVVRAKNPIQKKYNSKTNELIFHNHVEINEKNKTHIPTFTFVFYVQMPDNLILDDGVLFLRDKNGDVFSILPEIGDLIIMEGDLPHVPNYALNSTIDRIVLAGNVGLEYKKLEKSLI